MAILRGEMIYCAGRLAPQYRLFRGSWPLPSAAGTGTIPWCLLSQRATKTCTTLYSRARRPASMGPADRPGAPAAGERLSGGAFFVRPAGFSSQPGKAAARRAVQRQAAARLILVTRH